MEGGALQDLGRVSRSGSTANLFSRGSGYNVTFLSYQKHNPADAS